MGTGARMRHRDSSVDFQVSVRNVLSHRVPALDGNAGRISCGDTVYTGVFSERIDEFDGARNSDAAGR